MSPSTPSNYKIYFAGYKGPVVNVFTWYAGRFAGQHISSGLSSASTCQASSYCNYNSGEPNGDPCSGGSHGSVANSLMMLYNYKWNDVPAGGCTGLYNGIFCERSLSTLAADCVVANSVGVVNGSYAPNCTCICKPGYRGPKCQISSTTFTYNGFEHAGFCEGYTLNASASQARCKAQGQAWNLASIPDATVDAALRAMSLQNMWVGGAYDSTASMYRWLYGRRAGVYFSTSSGASVNGRWERCAWVGRAGRTAVCAMRASCLERAITYCGSDDSCAFPVTDHYIGSYLSVWNSVCSVADHLAAGRLCCVGGAGGFRGSRFDGCTSGGSYSLPCMWGGHTKLMTLPVGSGRFVRPSFWCM